jgi:Methyltransferase domain
MDVILQSPRCKICESSTELFGEGKILHKYTVKYFRCPACSFVQTEDPYWLSEAYSSAISRLDTGIISRNLLQQRVTASVIRLLFPGTKRSLDYGAGHGIFVRLMRDAGFEFFWYDPHASNDYARGFERGAGETYDFLTAFEVLEHVVDPIAELSNMMNLADNIFVSTQLVPDPTPRLSDWWYYSLAGGQHISLYSLDALQRIASRFGRVLLSRGSYHLFTRERCSRVLFRIATSHRASGVLSALNSTPSLGESDLQMLSSRVE